MTTVAVLADPPREGGVLPGLGETAPLSDAEVVDLYAAMLKDVCAAVDRSGGDLLVNYRADEDLPSGEDSSEDQLRAVVADAVSDPDSVRYEVQVGSSFSARAGNTVSHLLDVESVESVAVVEPTAVLLERSLVDSAAMKLRRSGVVLGPSSNGRVYFAAFTAPVDFEDAYEPPALETLTERSREAGHDVDFLPSLPVVDTGSDLASALSLLRARQRASHVVPSHTTTLLEELALTTSVEDGSLGLERA